MTTEERKEDIFKMWCAVWSATIHEGGASPDCPQNPALRRARFEEWWEQETATPQTSLPKNSARDLTIVTTAHPVSEQYAADVVVDVENGRLTKNRFGPIYHQARR